jgi:hypothetical protein
LAYPGRRNERIDPLGHLPTFDFAVVELRVRFGADHCVLLNGRARRHYARAERRAVRPGEEELKRDDEVCKCSGQVSELVLYAPPLRASLFAAFGLPPTG